MQTFAKDGAAGENNSSSHHPPPTAVLAAASACWLDPNLSLSQPPKATQVTFPAPRPSGSQESYPREAPPGEFRLELMGLSEPRSRYDPVLGGRLSKVNLWTRALELSATPYGAIQELEVDQATQEQVWALPLSC